MTDDAVFEEQSRSIDMDDNKIEADVAVAEESSSRNHLFIIFAVMLVVIVGLYVMFGKEAIGWIHDKLEHLVQSKDVLPRFILLLCQVPFGTVLFLPGLFYFNVMQSILMKNLLESWFISFLGGYLTSLLVFVIIRKYFQESVQKRFAHFEPYMMFKEETKSHPIRDGIILNFIFIPVSVKNYLMGVSSLTLPQAMVALTPGTAILCFLSAMVGSEVNNIKDLFTSKPFSKQTAWERTSFICSILLIILTLSILVAAGVYYKRKYKAFMERQSVAELPDIDNRESHNSSERMI